MLGGIEGRHVASVRGNARPARAFLGWARVLAGASALAFVGALSAVVATLAALANHDSVQELCGRNYTVDRHHLGIRKNVTGRLLGRLVLVKNRRSRTYCAVVILRHHNRKRFARVEISRTGPVAGRCRACLAWTQDAGSNRPAEVGGRRSVACSPLVLVEGHAEPDAVAGPGPSIRCDCSRQTVRSGRCPR